MIPYIFVKYICGVIPRIIIIKVCRITFVLVVILIADDGVGIHCPYHGLKILVSSQRPPKIIRKLLVTCARKRFLHGFYPEQHVRLARLKILCHGSARDNRVIVKVTRYPIIAIPLVIQAVRDKGEWLMKMEKWVKHPEYCQKQRYDRQKQRHAATKPLFRIRYLVLHAFLLKIKIQKLTDLGKGKHTPHQEPHRRSHPPVPIPAVIDFLLCIAHTLADKYQHRADHGRQ